MIFTLSTQNMQYLTKRIHIRHYNIRDLDSRLVGEISFCDDSILRYHAIHWTTSTGRRKRQHKDLYTPFWQEAKRFALTGQV